MKLSVVTISLNQGQFLEQCMRSVVSQRASLKYIGVELEYIVVDPGSTDESRAIIESYGDDIIKVFDQDEGPADGLNKGFAIASGDIFCYLNADDFFLDGAFVEAINVFRKSKCDIFYGHGWIVDESSVVSHRCLSHKFSLRQYALGNAVVMQQATFFKKRAFEIANGFNSKNRVSWDGELLVDMVLKGCSHKRINKSFASFRVYNASISGSGQYLDSARREHSRIVSKILEEYPIDLGSHPIVSKLLSRLSDPYYVLIRLVDQIQYGKRVIPS